MVLSKGGGAGERGLGCKGTPDPYGSGVPVLRPVGLAALGLPASRIAGGCPSRRAVPGLTPPPRAVFDSPLVEASLCFRAACATFCSTRAVLTRRGNLWL